MVKVAVLAPAATVTKAATVSEELLSDRVTLAPPAGAAVDRETVQVADAPEGMLLGEHCSADMIGGAALEPPTGEVMSSMTSPADNARL